MTKKTAKELVYGDIIAGSDPNTDTPYPVRVTYLERVSSEKVEIEGLCEATGSRLPMKVSAEQVMHVAV